jgi:hypothetical protein
VKNRNEVIKYAQDQVRLTRKDLVKTVVLNWTTYDEVSQDDVDFATQAYLDAKMELIILLADPGYLGDGEFDE